MGETESASSREEGTFFTVDITITERWGDDSEPVVLKDLEDSGVEIVQGGNTVKLGREGARMLRAALARVLVDVV